MIRQPADKNNNTKMHDPIVVIGAGPAGMLASLKLAAYGLSPILIGPQANDKDGRTTALMMPAIDSLIEMGVWDYLKNNAAPLSTMRILDGTSRLIRSPAVSFRSSEIGQKAFGYNMLNKDLNDALLSAIKKNKNITTKHLSVNMIEHHNEHALLTLSNGEKLRASLIVAADGRHSPARKAANIEVRQWDYPQTAIILSFAHALPHHNISTEFHTEDGPFTQVPLKGNNSSLVWVLNPQSAKKIIAMDKTQLSQVIEQRMQSLLGSMTITTSPQSWPLSGAVPKNFAAMRTILIGEAAHVFPPIGAQGLNLGFRDVINLIKALEKDPLNPGSDKVLSYYNKLRTPDVWARTGSVHALNHSLLSDRLPIQILRSTGLELLRNVSPLRHIFMREGMRPGDGIKEISKFLLDQKTKIFDSHKYDKG